MTTIGQLAQDDRVVHPTGVQTKKSQYMIGRRNRDKCLELVRDQGLSVKAALEAMGLTRHAYKEWRRKYPEFRMEMDLARVDHPSEVSRGWRTGFASFRKRYFGMDSPWFHQLVVEALETGEPGSITLVLLPPEHGKTTLIEDYCNYKLSTDPTFRITVGSEKQTHSKKVLGRCKARMGREGPCKEMVVTFGPFEPQVGAGRQAIQPWGSEHFNVFLKGDHDERDYSMQALGIGAAVAGTRADLLIIDDVQSRKSLNQTETIFEVIRQDWLSRPGSKGRTVMVGTRVGEDDIYHSMMEAGIIDHLICLPAINHEGKFLWPERYSEKEYERMKRNVGEVAWERNYLQRPRARGESSFNEEMLDACKNPLISVLSDPPEGSNIFVGIDPALGGANALVAAIVTPDKMTPIEVRTDVGLTQTEQILNILDMTCLRLNDRARHVQVTDVVIEEMAFQRGLVNDERLKDLKRKHGFRVHPHQTGHNKNDEVIGVAAMAGSFLRQEIVIPWAGDSPTQAQMEAFVAELIRWRPVRGTKLRMDRVMAFWFVWLRWRDIKQSMKADPSAFNTHGLPFPGIRVPKILSGLGPRGR